MRTTRPIRPLPTSDAPGYDLARKYFPANRTSLSTPSNRPTAVSLSQEATVERIFNDPRGRPKPAESERRRREFIRLLAAGESVGDAADRARISPKRVLVLLDQAEFRTVVFALLDGRADTVAVTVAPERDTLAA